MLFLSFYLLITRGILAITYLKDEQDQNENKVNYKFRTVVEHCERKA